MGKLVQYSGRNEEAEIDMHGRKEAVGIFCKV
jgi:hypothetical protein